MNIECAVEDQAGFNQIAKHFTGRPSVWSVLLSNIIPPPPPPPAFPAGQETRPIKSNQMTPNDVFAP